MPDFQRVNAPVFTPTQCVTCMTGSDRDGFVDLLVDMVHPIGHLYMCAHCLYQAGRQVGMLDPDQAQNLTDRLVAGQNTITQIQAELDSLKAKHLQSREEILDLFDDFGIKPPKEPKVALRNQ